MTARQSSLLIDEAPLMVIPTLAKAIGLNEAIMLQQLHYWSRISPHEQGGRRFVAMTTADLLEKFVFWSDPTIRRTIASLKSMGLVIITRKSTGSWDRTGWYAVEYGVLNRLNAGMLSDPVPASDQNDQMHSVNLIKSIRSKRSNRSDQNDQMSIKGKKLTTRVGAFAPPDWIPQEAWTGYEAMRIKARKPMTDRAMAMVVKRLAALKDSGQDVGAVLEQSERNSWADVYPVKTNGNQGAATPSGWWSSDQSIVAKARELRIDTIGASAQTLKSKINEKLGHH